MRLRSVIKAPKRYEDEMEGNTASKARESRQTRSSQEPEELQALEEEPRETRYSRQRRTAPTTYIDFNPNLPPAAFPTLDHPRPLSEQNHSAVVGKDKIGEEDEGHGVYLLPVTEHSEDYSHVPLAGFDHFLASNGPQNPVYAANMKLMSRESSSEYELDISDSDDVDDVPESGPEKPLIEDPTWSDLSLGLQIVIADNMLLRWDIAKIQNVLNLTNEELVELQRNLDKRDQDIEYEDRILEEMQATHMRKIMGLDLSQLQKYSIPEKTVMSQKSWARVQNVIKKNSKTDYFLCKVGDLRLAQKFLAKRGLPSSDAGEWGNDYVENPTISNYFEESNTFTWKEPEETPPTNEPFDETIADFQLGVSTTIDPRLLSQIPRDSAQQQYNEAAHSSTAASNNKGKARDTSGDMSPPYIPVSFPPESASDLPLLRRLASYPSGTTMIQQQWPVQNAALRAQEEQATMRWMNRDGQVIYERLPWHAGLTESGTAATMEASMMQFPVEASYFEQWSVGDELRTDADIEDEQKRLEEAMLTFINPEAYAQEPDESNDTSSPENPWGELLKGAGIWAGENVVTETAEPGRLKTPESQQVALPEGQSYVTPAPQSSPVPAEEDVEPTQKGKEKEKKTPGPGNIGGPTPPPSLPEPRQLRSWQRKRQSTALGFESPSDKRSKPSDSGIGGYNLRSRSKEPAKKK